MDLVEKLVAEDDQHQGNLVRAQVLQSPGLHVFGRDGQEIRGSEAAAKDFRIFWDNAYGIHHLYEEEEKQDKLLNILEECRKAGNPDMVYVFASTSKVSYAGAGISAVASSRPNLEEFKRYMGFQTIGYNKVNQLRHVRYFKNLDGVMAHMMKHAAVMRRSSRPWSAFWSRRSAERASEPGPVPGAATSSPLMLCRMCESHCGKVQGGGLVITGAGSS